MSMPRGCDVVELESGKWFVFVAIMEHDYDFRSFRTFGPFGSEDEAWDDGLSQVANPGAGCTYNYSRLTEEDRAKYAAMVKASPATTPRRNY